MLLSATHERTLGFFLVPLY
ncbi:hypothetical protein LINPERPRIM_LOCUS21915 [Linum perenne]